MRFLSAAMAVPSTGVRSFSPLYFSSPPSLCCHIWNPAPHLFMWSVVFLSSFFFQEPYFKVLYLVLLAVSLYLMRSAITSHHNWSLCNYMLHHRIPLLHPHLLSLKSTTAHMADQNRLVSCLFGWQPSWNYAQLLDWQWDVGLFSSRKTFKASHVYTLSSLTAAGFRGGWSSWAPRRKTETKSAWMKAKTHTHSVLRSTTSCNYEPDWTRLKLSVADKENG